MILEKFIESWRGMKTRNNLQLYAIIFFSVTGLLQTSALINQKVVVTVIPPNLSVEATVGADFASTSYLEAWGLFLSQALGNVTPSSVRFVKRSIEPILSPMVYQNVIKALEKQVDEIRSNHVTLYFEPRRITREEKTRKIFIHGQSVMESPTGDRERTERTYEFVFEVLNYMPSLTYIDTYPGPPRTIEEIDRMKQLEEKRRSRAG